MIVGVLCFVRGRITLSYLRQTRTIKPKTFTAMFYSQPLMILLLLLNCLITCFSVSLSEQKVLRIAQRSQVSNIRNGPQIRTQRSGSLQLFANGNCTGEMHWFHSDFNKIETPFNDKPSCVLVHGTESWIVYQHYNYHGKSVFLMGGLHGSSSVSYKYIRYLEINNQISAARRIPSSGVYFFENSHLSGTYVRFPPGQQAPSLNKFDDKTKSLIVFDECIKIFQHDDYTGKSMNIRRGVYMDITKARFPAGALSSFKPCN